MGSIGDAKSGWAWERSLWVVCSTCLSLTAHECQFGSQFNDIHRCGAVIHRAINCPPAAAGGIR